MAKKFDEKSTVVREHPRHVPVTKKNPRGITLVHRHIRRLPGTYLDASEIEKVFKKYDRRKLMYPTSKRLMEYNNSDKYDEHIAIWTDYFNNVFNSNPPLDPDVVKALIASESGFKADPPGNKIATGIAQITKQTLEILQDPRGEAKDFIFNKIRQKDLKDPAVAIPMAVRWLFRKKETVRNKLRRDPTSEELILEYKGMLKSGTDLKINALENFKDHYEKLKKE